MKQGELTRIEGFTLRYPKPCECRSFKELRDYAKRHGYKPGWAYIMAKELGIPLR